jgi:CRP/FNR family transcriptional regulator, anaerobic regulatory protein
MAFDLAPAQHRIASNCAACPVQGCPARCPATEASWRSMVSQLPSQMPGRGVISDAGGRLPALFSVRAGCIKTYTVDADGNERVRAFHFPGDLVGLESLGCETASASTAPVTPSQVCAVSADEVVHRLEKDAGLASHLLGKTRQALRQALALSGEFTADQRVAAFLLYVYQRIGHGDVVRLPMTRREMGSYLRLATETVCRVLTRFEDRGWIVSSDKRITLRDRAALGDLAEPVGLAA